ncbi:MAG: hypothetical protein HOD58_13500 [Gammaproteobacteria bacterium]|nr:hypothetical protein [Gammaproteobacteria bacterium]MBT4131047.1 hypothetical protein [Candidatus Neomarinimicrobiota bacterium]MBT4330923.1 hypothetical protein [Gammaproteobacteria bacterium]MBT5745167.1 hypothetical protein [Gammaproteobacteria bacterium]
MENEVSDSGDIERLEWLETLAEKLAKSQQTIVACSALKVRYRKLLMRQCMSCQTVWLHAPTVILHQRINARDNHFFPPHLLNSQLDTLETPDDAISIDSSAEPHHVVDKILQQLSL